MVQRTSKQQLIELIEKLEDDALVDLFLQVLSRPINTALVVQPTEAERKAIEDAFEDVKHGRLHSAQEAEEHIRPWL